MNNEFENPIRPEPERNNTADNLENKAVSPSAETAESVNPPPDASGYASPEIRMTPQAAQPDVSEVQPTEPSVQPEPQPVAKAASEPAPEIGKVPADAAYNPQSDTYSYHKAGTGADAQNVNGCAWDYTKDAKNAHRPPKKSSKGFKVFAASMLTVFTVSAVAIAALTAVDFAESRRQLRGGDSAPTTVQTGTDSLYGNLATMLSTFKDTEGGLTKAQVAAKCSPSAVGIVVEVQSSTNYYGGFFGDFYSNPQIMQGVGSGFIYNDEGYIITNHHVVEGAQKITVYLSDKTQVEAELIGSDELSDIAVIKVNPDGLNLVPMEIGNSDELVVGDEVIAIGSPAGIEFMGSVTDGIISAINRDVELSESGKTSKKTMTLLQTNATINKGNSGGPLLNAKGEVIGINTLKLGANYEGIGFSIPINGALPIISQLIEFGEVKERSENDFVSSAGVIGISASDITESESEYYDIPRGVLVVQIDKDSSAAEAGLRRGDIITSYKGTEVKSVNELNRLKESDKAGDEVTISVYRDSDDGSDGKTFDITFKLDAA